MLVGSSKRYIVGLSNRTDRSLSLTLSVTPAGAFSVTPAEIKLPAGTIMDTQIQFAPVTVGAFTGKLEIGSVDDDGGVLGTIPLAGLSSDAVLVATPQLDFGMTPWAGPGVTFSTFSLTGFVRNAGIASTIDTRADAGFIALSVSNSTTEPTEFGLSFGSDSGTLLPGFSAPVSVVFRPQSYGEKRATVRYKAEASYTTTELVAFADTVAPCSAIRLDPAGTIDAGVVRIDQMSTVDIRVLAPQGTCYVRTIRVDDQGLGLFSVDAGQLWTLAAPPAPAVFRITIDPARADAGAGVFVGRFSLFYSGLPELELSADIVVEVTN